MLSQDSTDAVNLGLTFRVWIGLALGKKMVGTVCYQLHGTWCCSLVHVWIMNFNEVIYLLRGYQMIRCRIHCLDVKIR